MSDDVRLNDVRIQPGDGDVTPVPVPEGVTFGHDLTAADAEDIAKLRQTLDDLIAVLDGSET